jgi:hypothetical protein
MASMNQLRQTAQNLSAAEHDLKSQISRKESNQQELEKQIQNLKTS